jgi:acyl-coenzyme A thioesterase PaaI-like protein
MDMTNVGKTLASFIGELVPMIKYAQMDVVTIDDNHISVKIPFIRENKNHLHSMYFGALSIGADAAGGLLAFYHAKKLASDVSIVFKDFKAEFLKRAEADVFFNCDQGSAISDLIAQAIASGQRQNLPVDITATANDDIVARFVLTLSVKLAQAQP